MAVGDAGAIVRFSSGTWTLYDSSTHNDLHGIWALSPSDVYSCGLNGTLLHFDGVNWRAETTPTTRHLYSVWGSGSSLFVSGTGGSIWRRQGQAWQEFVIAPGERFGCLGGYSAADIYAGGSNGLLYHFDGATWNRIVVFNDPLYDTEILDMWGPSPGKMAFVDRYNLLWLDGTNWGVAEVRDENAYGIWGFSLQQLVAVSAGSSTRLSNGLTTGFYTPVDQPLFDVWGTGVSDYYAMGRYGTALHFDGTGWQALSHGSVRDLRDVEVTPTGGLAVGQYGTILRRAGSAWTQEDVAPKYDLAAVWTIGPTEIAVGRVSPDGVNWREAILKHAGQVWSDVGPIGPAQRLFDVWGSSPTDVYAVGWAGELLHFGPFTWSFSFLGNGDTAYLKSIDGSASNNVVAVGRTNDGHALICRFDGATWLTSELGDVEELSAVWVQDSDRAFAVGSGGAIRRFSGSQWRRMSSPTTEPLFCVWGASASDVYAGGVDGTLIHYDGNGWRKLIVSSTRSIYAISGRSPDEVFLAGDKGSILFLGEALGGIPSPEREPGVKPSL